MDSAKRAPLSRYKTQSQCTENRFNLYGENQTDRLSPVFLLILFGKFFAAAVAVNGILNVRIFIALGAGLHDILPFPASFLSL